MTVIVPLPKSVQAFVPRNTHPGLMLDKFAQSWDPDARGDGGLSERVQKPALEAVVQLSQQPPQGVSYDALFQRRADTLRALNAQVFHCRTSAPLTLHLARASALENAGICLHPIYGFTFLVGTGLKGMARAFAETVWLPSQYDADASGKPENEAEIRKATDAWHTIEAVFGWAPNSDADKTWKPRAIPRRGNTEREHAGQIVFHDAWSTKWPKLIVDILNNHHPKYYQGQGDDAPGDWENPVPVYFLAVEPGQTFEFAVAKRRSDVPDALLHQARQWLLGALCHLGAGAKTNAGYGGFQSVEGPRPALVSPRHATFEATLELVTPAFLAGANQQREDCDLRPATLRGLLRWWWRTMHAGFVDVHTLRAMEAAIWGDTKGGGAVRVEVEPIGSRRVKLYDKPSHANMSPEAKRGTYGIPGGNAQKTTQGLWYASFGMDEKSRGERRQRAFRSPGEQWSLRLMCRRTANGIPASRVLEQAQAALWLLCHFDGAGSKSRKGFGSLTCSELPFSSVHQCEQAAQGFRRETRQESAFRDQQAQSPSLAQLLDVLELTFPWPNVWDVMDQVGFAYQAFAKQYAHRREKMAMGLPRRIGSRGTDVTGRFEPSGPVGHLYRDAQARRAEHNVRHSSPIHIHIDRQDQAYVVRISAFPAVFLPDSRTSKAFLKEFLNFMRQDLARRASLAPPVTSTPTKAPANVRQDTSRPARTLDSAGGAGWRKVQVRILAANATLSDAFFVEEAGHPRGTLQHGRPPAPLPSVGDLIDVYRNPTCNPRSPQYRWTPPEPPPQRHGRGGQSRRR